MKSYVLALAMAMIALPALAGELKAGDEPTKARVVNLPQDGDKLFLTIAGNPANAKYQQLNAWFKSDANLISIKNETHFNSLATNSVMFKERYAKTTPVTPIVRLQSPDGTPLYEAVGADIPATPAALASAINLKAEAGCPWRRRCQPQQQEAAPQEEEQPIVAPEPVKHEPEGVHLGVMLTVVGVCLTVGAAIGAVQYFKRVAHPTKK